jgi:hypothetical protein
MGPSADSVPAHCMFSGATKNVAQYYLTEAYCVVYALRIGSRAYV